MQTISFGIVLLTLGAIGVFPDFTVADCINQNAVLCITSEKAETCPENTYFREKVRLGNCCPGCVELPSLGDSCTELLGCEPGYVCTSGECVESPKGDCFHKRNSTKEGQWKPECLPDNTYAPKQCKGEPQSGKCFCVDPDGTRIFGEAKWEDAEDMTCACSTYVSQRIKMDQNVTDISVTIHCNDFGNYDILQCDKNICWCADEKTGTPFSSKVPYKMMKLLPCYSEINQGENYFRKCDSIRQAQENARLLMKIHGTTSFYLPPVSCNYDGSYARVQIREDNKLLCTAKDNTAISNFPMDLDTVGMNCNCAYDKYYSDGPFNLNCLPNGNYNPCQAIGQVLFCVDNDGFPQDCGTSIKCP